MRRRTVDWPRATGYGQNQEICLALAFLAVACSPAPAAITAVTLS